MSLAGKQLGRYRVLSLLGHGGMGSVWRGHDDKLSRDVALKILNRNRSKDNGADPATLNAQLFMQEARAVAKLQHPSVVSIYEVFEDDGQIILALELMEGGTLKECIERHGKLAPRELFRMMIGPARALAVAHKRSIIHRDIKPGNLMFDDHGNLKLMDFGLAEVAYEEASERMRGKAVGSLGWIAPETARGQGTTYASDIYGMGLVMLYALTGAPFFQSKSRSELIALHQNPPPLDVSAIKGLTVKGEQTIRRCLAIEQSERYASADELAEALKECAEEDPDRNAKQKRAYATIAVGAALFGAVVALCIILYVFGFSEREKEYRPFEGETTSRVVPLQYQKIAPTDPAGQRGPDGATPTSQAAVGSRLIDAHGPWPDYPELIDPTKLKFIGTRNGRYFHRTNSECGRSIYASNLANFDSLEDAIKAGREPCPKCRPDLPEPPPKK